MMRMFVFSRPMTQRSASTGSASKTLFVAWRYPRGMTSLDLDMRKLRDFVAVAEELNFGRAAQRLHIAQPVLSRQIRAFEVELGVRLLNRDTRGTTLTDAGSQLLQDARFPLSETKALREKLFRAAVPRRVVRVGVMPGLLATTAVRTFEAANPARRAEVVPIGATEQLDSVRDGTLDVVYAREPIDHRGLGAVALLEEPRDALLPADDLLAGRRSVRLAELRSHCPLQNPAFIPEWYALATPERRRATPRPATSMEGRSSASSRTRASRSCRDRQRRSTGGPTCASCPSWTSHLVGSR